MYCTFSSRDLIANVRFMYDTFLMGGMCYNCMTKVVHGSFMKVRLTPSNRNRPSIQHVPTFADTAGASTALHHTCVTTFVHQPPRAITTHVPRTLTHLTTLSYISFVLQEIYLVAHTAANVTLNISFSATSPSLAKYSIQQHRLLPDGELKVSAVLPSKDEFIADNVQVQLERVSSRESHLTVKNDEYKIVAKSRMYPWADRNLKRKRLDLTISPMVDEKRIPVAPHGLVGQVACAASLPTHQHVHT